ncbi:hypothetical protein Patl1_01029 [Pistacia atlantica]|uniref:Uncharacterized protein n=1 Tax=Pistacia atlantica TaxID=434234 RepID=A0ACC1C8H1_9ROSI|nr:hypothetical protein Patl1_01029 [Pistacia atlantica]
MAVAALSQQLLCFSTSTKTRTTTTAKPWFPNSTALFNSLKKSHASFISSSSSSSTSPSSETNAETAESCVNLGLSLFSNGRVKDALIQFETALSLDPNPLEAQAALYNKACCHAYRY